MEKKEYQIPEANAVKLQRLLETNPTASTPANSRSFHGSVEDDEEEGTSLAE